MNGLSVSNPYRHSTVTDFNSSLQGILISRLIGFEWEFSDTLGCGVYHQGTGAAQPVSPAPLPPSLSHFKDALNLSHHFETF